METANILQYNGNIVSDVNWRGNLPVNTLRVVTDNVEAEWTKGEVPTSFGVSLFGLDTEGQLFIDKKLEKTSVTNINQTIWFSSGNFILLRIDGKNYGNLVYDKFNFGWITTDFDNRYLLFDRVGNQWAGGYTGNEKGETLSVNSSKDTGNLKYWVKAQSQLDEFHTLLGRLYLCCKIIRIPSSGYSNAAAYPEFSFASFELYPYTFMFKEGLDTPSFLFLTRGEEGLTYSEFSQGSPIDNDNISLSISKSNVYLGYDLRYNIKSNTTNDFREFTVLAVQYDTIKNRIIQNLSYNSTIDTNIVSNNVKEGYPKTYRLNGCSLIHFIQEPYSKNRVYYGPSWMGTNGLDENDSNNYSSGTYKYHPFFETCSSKIITNQNNTISFRVVANSAQYIAYPNDFDYTIDLAGSPGITVEKSDYLWGDRSYTVLKIQYFAARTYEITFNRK